MSNEQKYLDLMQEVYQDGEWRSDRTGTGVSSLFGKQVVYDLADGFPLLTTKKIHWKSVVHELLWFLSGSTNIKYLQDNGVTIWNSWASEDGELGPIYGHSWRKWGLPPERIPQPKPKLRKGVEATRLGVGNGDGTRGHPLGYTWQAMMGRCYDKNWAHFKHYGGKGVSVCDRWLEFKCFAEDAIQLPGWSERVSDPDTRYCLDKDIRGNGFVYGPDSCTWLTDLENSHARADTLYTVEKNGVEYNFTIPIVFCREQGVSSSGFHALWNKPKTAKIRQGFTFVRKTPLRQGVDQIQNLIDGIKADPYSRRHIVDAWNPAAVPLMALPPCHNFWQVYVHTDGTMDILLYMRANDIFLGAPFNIASYSLLLMMLAQVTGYKPGRLIHTMGDVHLYRNHVDAYFIQKDRTILPPPTVTLNPEIKSIFDFKFEDINLDGYNPHPAIKAPVAV